MGLNKKFWPAKGLYTRGYTNIFGRRGVIHEWGYTGITVAYGGYTREFTIGNTYFETPVHDTAQVSDSVNSSSSTVSFGLNVGCGGGG